MADGFRCLVVNNPVLKGAESVPEGGVLSNAAGWVHSNGPRCVSAPSRGAADWDVKVFEKGIALGMINDVAGTAPL
jgi:hypothetical protein